jgi:hypothetical protein
VTLEAGRPRPTEWMPAVEFGEPALSAVLICDWNCGAGWRSGSTEWRILNGGGGVVIMMIRVETQTNGTRSTTPFYLKVPAVCQNMILTTNNARFDQLSGLVDNC